jgi:6-phosphogluconate dehydrogenase
MTATALGELAAGVEFLDMGVSGGVWGLQVGFCAMVGGDRAVFDQFEPVVATLAPPDGYLYCGPAGAGHYVKMVHNGIEYGLMEAYGEGFDILHASEFDLDLGAVARLWNNGSVIRSWLLELAGDAFAKEGTTAEIPAAADSGEGRWTVAEAIEHDVPSIITSPPSASAVCRIPTASAIGSWRRCATSSAGMR